MNEMSAPLNSWQEVQAELRHRISARIWKPGELIPTENELASEFGCSRATVNRAMREMAGTGLLERRRKAGTRVVRNPVRRATVDIPITRQEVEQRGAQWGHIVLSRKIARPGAVLSNQLGLRKGDRTMHLRSLHLADRQPFMLEDRWINLGVVPEFEAVDLNTISANEWLVQHAPFTHGDFMFSAANVSVAEAEVLNAAPDAAVFVIDRTTFTGELGITSVRLVYAPGYRMTMTA